jgi:hypothetical protein
MNTKWFVTLFAAVPFIAVMLILQSCGGEGGSTGSPTGGLPSPSAAFLALLSDEQRGASYVGSDACGECHGPDGEQSVQEHWQDSKHFEKGVGCERCHGPGSIHVDNPSEENILSFPRNTDPVVCGQCHGPTHEQYMVSEHNKLVESPIHEAIVDPNRYGRTSQCVNCHSGVFKSANERGESTPSMTNQRITELAEFTIGENPHSANCVSCHDPHGRTGKLTNEGEDVHLHKLTFNTDIGPVAPGTSASSFTNFDHICAQCHNGRGTNPADSALTSGTARPSMHDSNQYNMLMGFGGVEGNGPVVRNTAHANAPGQCSKCHLPDSRHTFTTSYDKSCAPCHTAADAAARITSTRSQIIDELLALRTRMEQWAQNEFGNDLFWEYTSNIQAEGFTPPSQASVPIQIKRARHNYYFVIRSGDYGAHNAPYARHLIQVANDNIDEVSNPNRSATQQQYKNLTTAQKLAILESDARRTRAAEARYMQGD